MPDLDLPRHSGATALACSYAETMMQAAGWKEADVSRVVLAIGEAVSNAVEHGPDLEAPIQLHAEADADHAILRIRDGGRGPTQSRLERASLPADPLAVGGRGLYILSQLANEIRREEPDTLVLTFRPR